MKSDPTKRYLDTVAAQIGWRRAKKPILRELADHIDDRAAEYVADGVDESTAVENAVRDMGDPIAVGREFDRLYKPRVNPILPILLVAMVALGLFINSDMFSRRTVWAVVLGIVALGVVVFTGVDVKLFGRYPIWCFLGVTLSAILLKLLNAFTLSSYQLLPTPMMAVSLNFLPLLYPIAFAVLINGVKYSGKRGLCAVGGGFVLQILMCIIFFSRGIIPIVYIADLLLVVLIPLRGEFVGLTKRVQAMFSLGIIIVTTLFSLGVFHLLNPNFSFEYASDFAKRYLEYAKSSDEMYKGYVYYKPSTAIFLVVFAAFCIVAIVCCMRLKSPVGFWAASASIITLVMQCVTNVAGSFGIALYSIYPLPLYSAGGASFAVNMLIVGVMLSAFVSDVLYRGDVRRRLRVKVTIES